MSLEASEVAVRVRLLGGSAFEKEAGSVAGSVDAIGAAGKKAQATLATTSSKLNSVGNKVMSFGRTLTTMGVPLAAVGYYAAKSATNFQQAMVLLSTQAGEAQSRIGGMGKAVIALAPQFGQTPLAMAKALYPIESIGKRGTDALNILKAAAMGSAVGLDTLENTADAVTTVIASHIKGAGGPVEAMSLMDKAIGVGKMHLADLTDSFKSAIIPMSQQFGVTFPQALAAEAALTRVGIPAAQVMARMRLIMTNAVAQGSEAAKAMNILGVHQGQLATDMSGPGGLLTAFHDLQMHLANFSRPDQLQLLAAIFGRSRGMGQISALLQAIPSMDQIYGQLLGTTPATLQGHFGQTEQTAAFKYQQIRARADGALITFGDVVNKKVLPLLVRLVPYLTKMVNGFTHLPKPLQDLSLAMAGLVIVGGPFFLFAGALIKGAGMFLAGIEAIVGPVGAAKLEVALASTASSFSALLPLMAGAAVYFGLFHTKVGKSIQHEIRNLGYNDAVAVGAPILHGLASLGLIHGNVAAVDQFAYEHSSAFQGLSARAQSDLMTLMQFTTARAARSPLGRGITNDLAQEPGFNLSQVPGLKDGVREAIREGMKEASVNVFLPNGRVLAQTVNDANRKDQNRR